MKQSTVNKVYLLLSISFFLSGIIQTTEPNGQQSPDNPMRKSVLYCAQREEYQNKKRSKKTKLKVKKKCVFCADIDSKNDAKNLLLARFKHNAVFLALFPMARGHILIIPYAHVKKLNELSREAKMELINLLAECEKIFHETLGSNAANIGIMNSTRHTFNVALLQLAPTNSVEKNVVKGLDACKKAQSLGADIALLPEMWQLNYDSNLMTLDNAISHSDNFIQAFCKQAKKLNMAIAITYLGKGKHKPTNNIAVIDRGGTIVLDYAKVHVCNFESGTEVTLESGNEFKVTALTFAGGSVKLGAMICFDRKFPESARTLMIKGAEIILVPNACPLHNDPVIGDVRLAQARSRAFENMVGIAITNYAQPKADGHSCAFNVDGKQLIMMGEREKIALAHFDLDKIREWRKKEVWGKSSLTLCRLNKN